MDKSHMDIDKEPFNYSYNNNSNSNNNNNKRKITEDNVNTRLYGESELVAEHLQFLPINFLDQMYNVLNIAVYRALEGLKPYLKYIAFSNNENNNDFDSTNRHEVVDEMFPEYEAQVETRIDKYFNIFQQYLLDIILYIPKNRKVTLEHYKDLDLSCTDEHIDLLDDELNKMRKEIVAQKALKHKLTIEEQQLDKALKCLEEYNNQTQFLSTLPEKHQVNPIKENIQHVLKEADELEDSFLKYQQQNSI